MRVFIVLVSYYTPLPTIRAVSLCQQFLPEVPILVVDNNRNHAYFQSERNLLKVARVGLLKTTEVNCLHGTAVDEAVSYLRGKADVMVHIEPDCVFWGRAWYDNLLWPIQQGQWMSGSFLQDEGKIHPTPSAWKLDALKTSFLPIWYTDAATKEVKGWDTGHMAWQVADREGKASLVETPDFRHFWGGSSKSNVLDFARILA